ncbi:MAG: putative aliphatic sulfonates-binding protein precursor [Pseudomonadota bacterium]|jgi:ABC-type nitrate/sulfonate/bicarbonate transport system substrate-binding protein
MNTLGAHHEFVLREYLRRAGLSKSEVDRVALVALPPVNTEQALRAGQVDVAVLGGIHRDKALERGGVRLVFSDYELFGAMTSASYVISERLSRTHPKTVEKFVAATARAIEWTRATPRDQVVARMESIIHKRGRAEDASLVRYFRAVSSETRGGLLTDAQFQRWIDWLVREGQLVPGQLKPSDVYTNQFNPYAAEGEGAPVRQSTALKSQ